MTRFWFVAWALFALLSGFLVALYSWADRELVSEKAERRLASLSELVIAHADAVLADADKIVSAASVAAEAWDLKDQARARDLANHMNDLLSGSSHISSAWILNPEGTNVLDTWTFPPRPIDASGRNYFKAHLAGSSGPVILADPQPGAVSGKQRFTLSRALRNPDNSLKAVVAAGILREQFDVLYNSSNTFAQSYIGLYTRGGEVLAHSEKVRSEPSRDFAAALENYAQASNHGLEILEIGGQKRLVAWKQSERFPQVFSSSSQAVEAIYSEWRTRALVAAGTTLLFIVGFAGLVLLAQRNAKSHQKAEAAELAAREVHHRVRNSLQLINGMIRMRSRSQPPGADLTALEEVSSEIDAIAEIHNMLQNAPCKSVIDITGLIATLCAKLQKAHAAEIIVVDNVPVELDGAKASSVAILVNELVTNALKHATSRVKVSCRESSRMLVVEVQDDGPGLPENFSIAACKRFGLRTVASVAKTLGGNLTHLSTPDGALFRIEIPMKSVSRA